MYQEKAKDFYDNIYHAHPRRGGRSLSRHFSWLFKKVDLSQNSKVLDIGCGTGDFLLAAFQEGAQTVAGIDISSTAIEACKTKLPDGQFTCARADNQHFPYGDNSFDICVSMGSLEHFENIPLALAEMQRVAKPDGIVLISVPNADFLARKIGLFQGTEQTIIKETVNSLAGWRHTFEAAGFSVKTVYKDLHMANWRWLKRRGVVWIPIRILILATLSLLPLKYQYQNYYLLTLRQP